MKTAIFLFLCLSVFLAGCQNNKSAGKPEILLVTGGHNFDTAEFFNVFDSFDQYDFTRKSQPEANEYMGSEEIGKYSIIIFYDMWDKITEEQKKYYTNITMNGTGLLFLHHSLVSYQEWDEFRNIIGGKYIQEGSVDDSSKFSGYRHDIELEVNIIDPEHPVTSGIENFKITDEGYSNFIVEKNVKPLLSTKHPDSGEIIGWTHKFNNSGIVYLMLGHDSKAYSNENFRKLIGNSIQYLSKKDER